MLNISYRLKTLQLKSRKTGAAVSLVAVTGVAAAGSKGSGRVWVAARQGGLYLYNPHLSPLPSAANGPVCQAPGAPNSVAGYAV